MTSTEDPIHKQADRDLTWHPSPDVPRITISRRERAILDRIDGAMWHESSRTVPSATVLRTLTRVIAYWRRNDFVAAEGLLKAIERHQAQGD